MTGKRKPKQRKPKIGKITCGVNIDRNSDSGVIFVSVIDDLGWHTVGIGERECLQLARDALECLP